MNRFNRSRPPTRGGDRSAVAGGTASGSSPSSSSNTDAPGGSYNTGFPVSHELGSGLAASSSGTGSNGTSRRTPLPSTLSPSPRSALLSSSACSAAESFPWLSLSTTASSGDESLGKRRMAVDADVRSAEGGPRFFDGGNNSDSVIAAAPNAPTEPREVPLGSGSTRGRQQDDEDHDGERSGEPFLLLSRSPPPPPPPPPSALPPDSSSSSPSPPSFLAGHWKQRSRQLPQPATHQNGNGNGNGNGNARDGPAGESAGGGDFPAPRSGGGESPLTERPSTPAPPTHRGQRRQQPAGRLRGATPSPSLSSSSSPPLDTIMDDHDRFEEISRAEELALAAAATSIQTVKNRQLAVLEGIAITHSRLLQRDNGFQLRADVDRLLDATRSLLGDLGLEVDDHAAAEPMDQEAAGAEAPPSPLGRQPETRDPVDVAAPSAFEQDTQASSMLESSMLEKDTQAPTPPLPPQGQASPRKTVAQLAAFRGGGAARSRTALPVGTDPQKSPPPVSVEGGGVAGDAMDVP